MNLGGLEPWLYVHEGDLLEGDLGWTQPPDHYALFFFEHDGNLTINNRLIPFQPGNIGFIAPGAKVAFDRIGQGTSTTKLTFAIKARTDWVSVPAVADLGDSTEFRRNELRKAVNKLQFSIMPLLAFAFSVIWSVAQPDGIPTKSNLISIAENLILQRLSEKIGIGELSRELGVSHAQLLRLFREEHGSTVQEFIRDQRVQYARSLLIESSLEIKEVAIRSGIPNLQHFNKLIRYETGLSPRALRKQAEVRTRH